MNKKIFTLLASLLMLFFTAFVVNAQPVGYHGVQYLPEGIGKGSYHLQVTHFGAENLMSYANPIRLVTPVGLPWPWAANHEVFLSLNSFGFLDLVSADEIADNYTNLRSALWCVNVEREIQGKVPTFNFINKEYSTYLSVDSGRWTGTNFGASAYIPFGNIRSQRTNFGFGALTANTVDAHVDGYHLNWSFSSTYNTTPLEQGVPLALQIDGQPGYFMTFACMNPTSPFTANQVELVKVHGNDLDPDNPSDFYKHNLLFFRLVSAAPRVLSASDFNTMLGDRAIEDFVSLIFDPTTNPATNNMLAQPLKATDVSTHPEYVRLQNAANQYVYVADGTTASNYYNALGKHYPKIVQGTRTTAQLNLGESDFRLVYYPAEDSLVINVRYINHIDDGVHFDDELAINKTLGDGFYNMTIWNHLIVKLQDLVSEDGNRIVTVYDVPPHTRIHFGIGDCRVIDDRTTVPPNLYVIKDHLGRYLDMPLEVGDFTPQWRYLKENEKPLKTPSSQWLVNPTNKNSAYSPIRLINREFNWVYIDFVQVYGSPHLFRGTITYASPLGNRYANIQGLAEIYYTTTKDAEGFFGSFKVVEDDADVVAAVRNGRALTQDQWQRRYRTSPYLGYKYIAADTMNFFGYAFNYLHDYSKEYYLHTPPESLKDTVLYVNKARNYFMLELPIELRPSSTGTLNLENYGIGHGTDGAALLNAYSATRDIAPLKRYYYYFQQQDYWNFAFNDNYISLDRNGRYVFSNEAGINANPLEKAKFYLRFTYQPDGKGILGCDINSTTPEYYTLLNRIDQSNFHYVNTTIGLQILDTLRIFDWSHSNVVPPTPQREGFGVVSASVDDYNLYVRAQAKTGGATRVSTFALSTIQEPLYRRFDDITMDCDIPDGAPRDYPRTLKIYRTFNPKVDYIYEDRHSTNADGKGINFGSFENIYDRNKDRTAGNKPWLQEPYHNYAIYVDTAYVNRGTGHIKPQYLLVVGPEFNDHKGCYLCGDLIEVQPWIYGRYLINATDSARIDPSNVSNPLSNIRDMDYIWNASWDRIAFVNAIHAGDSLYILQEIDYMNYIQIDDLGVKYLNFKALIKALQDKSKARFGNSHPDEYIINLGNNLHKDVVWSMRFYKKPGENAEKNFLLESETTDRDAASGPMIAPMHGGWVKEQNNELVISRGSYKDAILEAEKWNTECADMTPDKAVGNEALSAVQVIAGQGTVTILNAAGKQVAISNVLGQTVANTVLTSDNVTINAPKGVLVVAVEGESAVKAVVK